MTWFVRVLLAIDAAAAAVILYFFVIGLADGSVSSFNGALWAAILAGVAAILGGGTLLNANGKRALAAVLLLVLAIPATLFGLFALAMIVAQPNWR
jgi:hypothetical protein